MTTTTLPAAALVPVVKTAFYPRITRSGLTRPECWSARTEDGEYVFERLEMTGTPWEVRHLPTGTALDWRTSLRACREYVTNGWAAEALDRLLAHERGEHEAGRIPSCRRC